MRRQLYSWHASLLGAVLTVASMIFLNPVFALVTIALVALLILFIYCTFDGSRWVDISQAYTFTFARRALLALGHSQPHPKLWRPNLLVLLPHNDPGEAPASGGSSVLAGEIDEAVRTGDAGGIVANDVEGTALLLATASQIAHGALLVVGRATCNAATASSASLAAPSHAEAALAAERSLREHMEAATSLLKTAGMPHPDAFQASCVSASPSAGAVALALTSGLGAMQPNTVLMPLPPLLPASFGNGDGQRDESSGRYATLLREVLALRKNVLVFCNAAEHLRIPAAAAAARSTSGSSPPQLNVPVHAPSVASHGRAPRVDVWLLGPLPSSSAWEETLACSLDSVAALDVGLALQFGFLSHAALGRSAPSRIDRLIGRKLPASAKPSMRVLQLRSPADTTMTGPGSGSGTGTGSASDSTRDAGATRSINSVRGAAPGGGAAADAEHAELRRVIAAVRVPAEAVVLQSPLAAATASASLASADEALQLNAMIREHSADASMVVLLLPLTDDHALAEDAGHSDGHGLNEYTRVLHALTAGLPPTLLAKSGGSSVVTTEI
jgi:hypothetical protein